MVWSAGWCAMWTNGRRQDGASVYTHDRQEFNTRINPACLMRLFSHVFQDDLG